MKAAEWQRLTRPVFDDRWRLSKTLAYRVPVGWVLHGLLAEDSPANHPDFYIWLVRMPLVVPTDLIDLSWSERFGDSSRAFEPGAAVTQEALMRAAKLVSEQAARGEFLVDPPGGADNIRMQEARAYALLLMGNAGGATEVLRRVLRYDARYPWEQELVRRAEGIRWLVDNDRLGEAVHRIEGWRSESLAALRVEPE